jgi:hypothetical protein
MKYKASKNPPTAEGSKYTLIWTFNGRISSISCRIKNGIYEDYSPHEDEWRSRASSLHETCTDIYYLTAR